jgi:hypothetical protein
VKDGVAHTPSECMQQGREAAAQRAVGERSAGPRED